MGNTISEKSVHEMMRKLAEEMRKLAEEVWATHGICIQTVRFSWVDISSILKADMIVDEVSMTTLTKGE